MCRETLTLVLAVERLPVILGDAVVQVLLSGLRLHEVYVFGGAIRVCGLELL